MSFISYFLIIAGFVIGLGAVTVIDLHGFLGRRSGYWTEATTRTHKITKPLIWIGTLLFGVGVILSYSGQMLLIQLVILALLILNGCFLSFSVSPYLLRREQEGKSAEVLPPQWQHKITASFIVSFLGWWGSVVIFVMYLI